MRTVIAYRLSCRQFSDMTNLLRLEERSVNFQQVSKPELGYFTNLGATAYHNALVTRAN